MHRTLEKQLSARAVELGKAGDGAALPELVELLGSDSVQVRRLAASAIGKLAGFANAESAVAAVRAHLDDAHPQVRQYAVKALKAYGADASDTLSDLRDMAANESEKEYNRRDAQAAIDVIEEALRIREKLYQQEGKKLVSVEREDTDRIETVLEKKLSRHIRVPDAEPPSTATAEGGAAVNAHSAPTPDTLIPDVGEEAEVACMFDVLDRYRDCLRLLLFRDTGRPPPERALNDAERLKRTRAYCLRLRKNLAAILGATNSDDAGQSPPPLSTLLRALADAPSAAERGKNREPCLLAWRLTHPPAPHALRLSSSAASVLWYLRVNGRLDPEDEQVPAADLVSALLLFMMPAPGERRRQAISAASRMLTALDAPQNNTRESEQI